MDRVLEEAENLGYEEAKLDTLSGMEAARGLYERKGFLEVDKYYDTPGMVLFLFLFNLIFRRGRKGKT